MNLPEIEVLVNGKSVEHVAEHNGVLFKHPDRHYAIVIPGGTTERDDIEVVYIMANAPNPSYHTKGGPKRIKVPTHDQMKDNERGE